MKEFLKNNFLILAAALVVLGLLGYIVISSIDRKNEVKELKRTILLKDSLVKVREGQYTKLVNDMKSSSDLKKEVKEIDPRVSEDIKKAKEKPIMITTTKVVPVVKTTTDTVYVNGETDRKIVSYYPNPDSAFIKHTSVLTGASASSTWEFKPLKLNVIVTQQKDGMYRARLIGPNWLQAEEVTVNSLPLTPVVEKKLRFMAGVGAGFDFYTNKPNLGVYTGIKYNNTIILLNGATNQVVSVGVVKIF